MTVLVTGDFQLDDNPINAYRHAFQKQLRDIAKKHGVECCIVLGDLTEEKDRHSAWLVNKIVDHLERLRRICPVVIIQGNHDYVDVANPFYQFVRHISGINWINTPTEAGQYGQGNLPNIHELSLSKLGRVLLLPHTTNYKADWRDLKLKKYDCIFTHNTFQNVHVGHGIQARGIPTSIFGQTRVISGDIHIPQTLEPDVNYVGAPYLCDFGDDYFPRVMMINRDGYTSIPVSGSQKRLIEMDARHGGLVISGDANQADILKVRVEITADQRAKWPEIKARVRQWGDDHDYIIHVVQPVLADTERGVVKRPQHKQQSDNDLLRTYAKHRAIDERTLHTGLVLLRKV